MESVIALLSVWLICATVLACQWSHFHFQKSERDHVDAFRISEALEKKLKDFDDLKKQVDVLVLKAGFGR